ncbi:hypothetical protein B296_00035634, partial [Ensete ventricosum]
HKSMEEQLWKRLTALEATIRSMTPQHRIMMRHQSLPQARSTLRPWQPRDLKSSRLSG